MKIDRQLAGGPAPVNPLPIDWGRSANAHLSPPKGSNVGKLSAGTPGNLLVGQTPDHRVVGCEWTANAFGSMLFPHVEDIPPSQTQLLTQLPIAQGPVNLGPVALGSGPYPVSRRGLDRPGRVGGELPSLLTHIGPTRPHLLGEGYAALGPVYLGPIVFVIRPFLQVSILQTESETFCQATYSTLVAGDWPYPAASSLDGARRRKGAANDGPDIGLPGRENVVSIIVPCGIPETRRFEELKT